MHLLCTTIIPKTKCLYLIFTNQQKKLQQISINKCRSHKKIEADIFMIAAMAK